MNRNRSRRSIHPSAKRREGFAMFMALGALVIIAVLVAGSSYLTLHESQLGQNELVQSRAFAAAEYGLNKIQTDWDKTPNLQMNNGAKFDTSYVLTGQGTCTVRYTRLNNETFWIVSEGRATVGNTTLANRTAVKRVSAILRLRIPTIKVNGAITANGQMTAKGSVQVYGANVDPAGWSGCSSAPGKPGLVVPPGVTPDIQKASNVVTPTGIPQYINDPLAANDNTYVRFGDETWNTLANQANQRYLNGAVPDWAPTTIAGACNKTDPNNAGEPHRTTALGGNDDAAVSACYNYFPILYATCTPPPDAAHTCTVTLNNGRGQGILMIDGDAVMNGKFEWMGLIIVSGDIGKGNGAAHISGGVMARNADVTWDGGGSDVTGNATYQYSACSVEHAVRGSAQVVQAKSRSWVELY